MTPADVIGADAVAKLEAAGFAIRRRGGGHQGGGRPALRHEVRQRIIALAKTEGSRRAIARETGVCADTVRRVLRRHEEMQHP